MSATIKSSADGNTTTIGTNGGNTLAINSTGNVGIGDDTPTDAKLKVYASSALAAMRVVQEGTGNALEVYDDASDTTPFTIDNAGNVKIDGGGDFRLNKPADAWSGTYIDIDKAGSLSTQGSYEVNLTSNGYRRSSDNAWVSLSANNDNRVGASQLRLSPNGSIVLATNATKGTGSSTNPTTRLTVNDTGATIVGKMDVTQNSSTEAGLNVTQSGTGLAIRVNDMPSDNSPFVVDASGHVGIGVAAPTAMLHLSSIESILPAVKITNSGSGGDSFLIEDQATDPSPFVIKNDGKVGIGTTTPDTECGLHVKGYIATDDFAIKIENTSPNGYSSMLFGKNANVGVWRNGDLKTDYAGASSLNIGSTIASNVGIITNNITRMKVTSGGNVGIGTTSPNEKLHVAGNIYAEGQIRVGDKFISYGRNGTGGIHFGGETTLSGSLPVTDGAVFQYQENLFGTAYDGLLIEKTDFNSTVPEGGILFANRGSDGITVPALAIRGSGEVGIGIKDPAEKLEVSGNIKVSGNINGITVGTGAWADDTNTAVGRDALDSNTGTGDGNTAIGCQSLSANTIGDKNTAVGFSSLLDNLTGSNNTAAGYNALQHNKYGSNNTAIGYVNLRDNVRGDFNTVVGSNSLYQTISATANTTLGYSVLDSATVDTKYNTAIGYSALNDALSGTGNTALGYVAGDTFIGGDKNIFIGHYAKPKNDSSGWYSDNQIVIGNDVAGKGPDTTSIGNSDTSYTYIYGDVVSSTGKFGDNEHNDYIFFNTVDDKISLVSNNYTTFTAHESGCTVEKGLTVFGNINANALIQKSVTKSAAATLTVDEVVQGYIITTGSTYNLTLSTGALFDSGYTSAFGSSLAVGDMIEFTILNNASGTVTLAVAVGITDTTVGTLTVATNTVKRFFLRKTAASAFSLYAGA